MRELAVRSKALVVVSTLASVQPPFVDMVARVVPEVSKERVFASLVPIVTVPAKVLPLLQITFVVSTGQALELAAAHDSSPEPSVVSTCPAVPSSTGKVKILF